MNKPEKLAYDLLRKHRILNPTLEQIVFLVEDSGYELIDFDPEKDTYIELVKTLGLDESILHQPAFLYANKDVKLLFLRDSLDANEKRYALAHEFGHIVCGHLSQGDSVLDEYEANEFVHYFLNPGFSRRLRHFLRERRMILASACVVLMLAAGLIVYFAGGAGDSSPAYYATASGHKYHRKDCSLIKDKTNLHRLTEAELASGVYEPCSRCLGGEIVP